MNPHRTGANAEAENGLSARVKPAFALQRPGLRQAQGLPLLHQEIDLSAQRPRRHIDELQDLGPERIGRCSQQACK